jgi:hypothetical protein
VMSKRLYICAHYERTNVTFIMEKNKQRGLKLVYPEVSIPYR